MSVVWSEWSPIISIYWAMISSMPDFFTYLRRSDIGLPSSFKKSISERALRSWVPMMRFWPVLAENCTAFSASAYDWDKLPIRSTTEPIPIVTMHCVLRSTSYLIA